METHKLYSPLNAKRVGIALVALVVLVAGGRWSMQHMFTSGEAHSARERVRRILDGMKPGGDRQAAIGLWYQGTLHVPGGMEIFNIAASGFEAWEAKKQLTGISAYEITGAEVTQETGRLGEATVIVSGSIDGEPFRMKVVQGQPIDWVD